MGEVCTRLDTIHYNSSKKLTGSYELLLQITEMSSLASQEGMK